MSTTTLLVISLLVFSVVIFGILMWFHMKSRQESAQQLQEMSRQILEAQRQNQSTEFLQREIINLRDQISKSVTESARLLNDSQKNVGERLDRAAEVVGNVQRSLGALDNATKQVFMVGKDIAQLQEILRAPKLRGSMGELFLGDLLAQILPSKSFSVQHTFRSGEIVDAVVKLGGRMVPVDSKFPLENFRRFIQLQDPQEKTVARKKFVGDVKRHIDAIASKYILLDENTYDFALMYIPAENVYYEMIIKDDNLADEENSIMTYAFSKRVVPVSPNSFYSYLHTISLGLRGLEVEQNARLIIEQLGRLRGDFIRFREDFMTLGKHLNSARSKFEDTEKRVVRFEDKLMAAGAHSSESLGGESDIVPSLPFQS